MQKMHGGTTITRSGSRIVLVDAHTIPEVAFDHA